MVAVDGQAELLQVVLAMVLNSVSRSPADVGGNEKRRANVAFFVPFALRFQQISSPARPEGLSV
jgi:hypothetical protein